VAAIFIIYGRTIIELRTNSRELRYMGTKRPRLNFFTIPARNAYKIIKLFQ